MIIENRKIKAPLIWYFEYRVKTYSNRSGGFGAMIVSVQKKLLRASPLYQRRETCLYKRKAQKIMHYDDNCAISCKGRFRAVIQPQKWRSRRHYTDDSALSYGMNNINSS